MFTSQILNRTNKGLLFNIQTRAKMNIPIDIRAFKKNR